MNDKKRKETKMALRRNSGCVRLSSFCVSLCFLCASCSHVCNVYVYVYVHVFSCVRIFFFLNCAPALCAFVRAWMCGVSSLLCKVRKEVHKEKKEKISFEVIRNVEKKEEKIREKRTIPSPVVFLFFSSFTFSVSLGTWSRGTMRGRMGGKRRKGLF